MATTGAVKLGRFYGARARRLLPASATVGVATAIGSVIFLPPLQARHVLVDAVTSALYVGNYGLAVQGTDYLASDLPPSPFQHYWSLGVEEQFYLVVPFYHRRGVAEPTHETLGRRTTFASNPLSARSGTSRIRLLCVVALVDPHATFLGFLLLAHSGLGIGPSAGSSR